MTSILAEISAAEEWLLVGTGLCLKPGRDQERWNKLDRLYRSSGIWEDVPADELPGFACRNATRCDQLYSDANSGTRIRFDHRGTIANYFAAGYDRVHSAGGCAIRLCFVSMDSGGWTFDFRTQTLLDGLSGLDYRNPHWRETRKLAHYLYFGDWCTGRRLSETLISLKLFAHTRALKCNGGTEARPSLDDIRCASRGTSSDGTTGTRSWHRPAGMYHLCTPYLKDELRILEPTIIIAQGCVETYESTPCAIWSVTQAMDSLSPRSSRDIREVILGGRNSGIRFAARVWTTPWGITVMLGADHPRNVPGYHPALHNGILPAIDRIRQAGFDVSDLWRSGR